MKNLKLNFECGFFLVEENNKVIEMFEIKQDAFNFMKSYK